MLADWNAMKRYPKCRRDYYDDSLTYCLDDGAALLDGPSSGDNAADVRTEIIDRLDSDDSLTQRLEVTTNRVVPRPRGEVAQNNQRIQLSSLILVAAGVLFLGALFTTYYFYRARPSNKFSSMEDLKVVVLASGTIVKPAISPDGKYVAYVSSIDGQRSIRLRQTAATSDVEIVAPDSSLIPAISFTPDGNFLYYLKVVGAMGTLYQVPVLGGQPKRIAYDVASGAGVSADGKEIAYVRSRDKRSNLLIANADGTNERMLSQAKGEDGFGEGTVPSWSGDGSKIATWGVLGTKLSLITVDARGGQYEKFGDLNWTWISGIQWLPNSGLVVAGSMKKENESINSQIWLIGPNGDTRRLNNDPTEYVGVSVTAGGNKLISARYSGTSDLWTLNGNVAESAKQLTTATTVGDCSWGPDGDLFFTSQLGGNISIWKMKSDGSGKVQIISKSGLDLSPRPTPDNKFLVFTSDSGGTAHVWRADMDGSNLRQLTDGPYEELIGIEPDGKAALVRRYDQAQSFWSVPVDGSPATQIPAEFPDDGFYCTLSPIDGSIACITVDDQTGERTVSIVERREGKLIRRIGLPTTALVPDPNIRFTPDGKSIAFLDRRSGGLNIWAVPIDGSAEPKTITDFKNQSVRSFSWSADGKQLAVIRGNTVWDLVLITDATH